MMTSGLPRIVYWMGTAFGLAVAGVSVAFAAYLAASKLNIFEGPSATPPDWALVAVMALVCVAGLLTGGAIIAWAIFARRVASAAGRGMSATVDSEGVTVRYLAARGRAWGEARIAWRDVRALACVNYGDEMMGIHSLYILDAERETILWEAPPVRRFTLEREQARVGELRAAADRLLVAARAGTGMPLLDLSMTLWAMRKVDLYHSPYGNPLLWTPLNETYFVALQERDFPLALDILRLLRQPKPGKPLKETWFFRFMRRRPASTAPANPARHLLLRTTRAMLPYFPASPDRDPVVRDGRIPRAGRLGIALKPTVVVFGPLAFFLIYLAVSLPFMLLSGRIAAATSSYSTPLEQALPATVAGMTPTYFAPLDTAQPGWLVKAPGGSDTRSAQFTPQGYTLMTRAEWQTIAAPAPGTAMSDGAAEVTVSLSDPLAQNYGPEAGLLLQNRDKKTGLAFEIDGSGYWSLVVFNRTDNGQWIGERSIAWGSSDAIREGEPNIQIVIRRGATYLLYINGVFMQAVHDDTPTGAPGGPVSLFVNTGGLTATFTDLAVYPVPDGMPFWAR